MYLYISDILKLNILFGSIIQVGAHRPDMIIVQ